MLPQLSLLDPRQRTFNVQGQADVTVRSDIRVRVDGGQVTQQSTTGANVSVPLNTGRGMLDTGYHGHGSR